MCVWFLWAEETLLKELSIAGIEVFHFLRKVSTDVY